LLKALEFVPEVYRIVFVLSVIEGFSHKEISERLGITEKTSTTRLVRARQRLKAQLVSVFNTQSEYGQN